MVKHHGDALSSLLSEYCSYEKSFPLISCNFKDDFESWVRMNSITILKNVLCLFLQDFVNLNVT